MHFPQKRREEEKPINLQSNKSALSLCHFPAGIFPHPTLAGKCQTCVYIRSHIMFWINLNNNRTSVNFLPFASPACRGPEMAIFLPCPPERSLTSAAKTAKNKFNNYAKSASQTVCCGYVCEFVCLSVGKILFYCSAGIRCSQLLVGPASTWRRVWRPGCCVLTVAGKRGFGLLRWWCGSEVGEDVGDEARMRMIFWDCLDEVDLSFCCVLLEQLYESVHCLHCLRVNLST